MGYCLGNIKQQGGSLVSLYRPFLISTMGGSIIAGLLIKSGILTHLMPASFSGRAGK